MRGEVTPLNDGDPRVLPRGDTCGGLAVGAGNLLLTDCTRASSFCIFCVKVCILRMDPLRGSGGMTLAPPKLGRGRIVDVRDAGRADANEAPLETLDGPLECLGGARAVVGVCCTAAGICCGNFGRFDIDLLGRRDLADIGVALMGRPPYCFFVVDTGAVLRGGDGGVVCTVLTSLLVLIGGGVETVGLDTVVGGVLCSLHRLRGLGELCI